MSESIYIPIIATLASKRGLVARNSPFEKVENFDRVQEVEKAALPHDIGKFLQEQGGYLGNS